MSNTEVRFAAAPIKLELREDKPAKIRGMAAIYEQRTSIGWWDEEIASGAFDNADFSDVRALFNHDSNQVLGRTKSGTLQVRVTPQGLEYEIDPPDTANARDVMELLKRGDVDQSSFAFTVKEQEWIERKGEKELRRITEIDQVFDVSPVTYPAYDGTTSEARSIMNLSVVTNSRQPSGDKERRARDLHMLDVDLFTIQHLRARQTP